MNLQYGSMGPMVTELQERLNQLPPSKLAPLAVDGRFGPKTRARVMEIQRNNKLVADGIVGPKTMGVLIQLLQLLGGLGQPGAAPPAPGASDVSVRPITKEVLGMEPTNGLIQQVIPQLGVVDVASFKPGDWSNAPSFSYTSQKVARLGIFAARKGNSERAVILVLPPGGKPNRVMIGISHGFGQNAYYYSALGWTNPLSPPLIQDVLLRHVVKRWGAQVLAGKRPMALLHIVRAAGSELGPFANDGAFVREVLERIAAITNDAFAFDAIEAFTYSSGISDFNLFLASLKGHLNVQVVYNVDPKPIMQAMSSGIVAKQYLSGITGPLQAGFEYLPLKRWKNELFYYQHTLGLVWYLHAHCLPIYTLYLGIQMS